MRKHTLKSNYIGKIKFTILLSLGAKEKEVSAPVLEKKSIAQNPPLARNNIRSEIETFLG